jgi:hypothetical protein
MSYTVEHRNGCYVMTGPVPLQDLAALLGVWGLADESRLQLGHEEEWVVDALLCQALGATVVCGTRRDTLAWREQLGLAGAKEANDGGQVE